MKYLNLTINHVEIPETEYQQERVLTLKLIDQIHGRPEGTAYQRFNDNKLRFIKNKDYFALSAYEFHSLIWESFGFKAKSNSGILMTESGYLLLVKSFNDDLAWDIQRQLVDCYFKTKTESTNLKFSDWDKNRLRISAITQRLPAVRDALELKMLWEELKDRCAISGLPAPDYKLIGKDIEQSDLGFNVQGLEDQS